MLLRDTFFFFLVAAGHISQVCGWRMQLKPEGLGVVAKIGRREMLLSSATVLLLGRPSPTVAEVLADINTLKITSSQLKGIVSNIDAFTASVASETSDVKLPAQVPLRVFQKLEAKAHDVTLRKASEDGTDDGFFPAEDFLAVAQDYAEHAGAARDLYKLSKLGRVGENGSDDVAISYAKRCGEEARAASALLEVLALAVQ